MVSSMLRWMIPMVAMALVVCGGFHDPQKTHQMVATLAPQLDIEPDRVLVFVPTSSSDILSAQALRQWLAPSLAQWAQLDTAPTERASAPQPAYPDVLVWAFSAGCVGAAGLVNYWHRYRGTVRALFMVDGWGVPGPSVVPVHRLSHDWITHVTSPCWGCPTAHFYADPGVPHRQLWRSPDQVAGWQVGPPGEASLAVNAADVLISWSRYYGQRLLDPYQQLITHNPKMLPMSN